MAPDFNPSQGVLGVPESVSDAAKGRTWVALLAVAPAAAPTATEPIANTGSIWGIVVREGWRNHATHGARCHHYSFNKRQGHTD